MRQSDSRIIGFKASYGGLRPSPGLARARVVEQIMINDLQKNASLEIYNFGNNQVWKNATLEIGNYQPWN